MIERKEKYRYIIILPITTTMPSQYPWSSFSAYPNQEKVPDWLNRDSAYGELGSRAKYSAYRAYIEQDNEVRV